jgi:enoyl-CoA hydratase/carnithine racemase
MQCHMPIHSTYADGVATLTIARPEKKNALTMAMYEAMTEVIANAQSDGAVRALLITGQPGVFTSGNDLTDFVARPPSGEDSPVFQFMHALSRFEKPVVAAVCGAAIGIGTTLLLHCDLVYVAEDARLAMPFVSLGLVPEFASSLLLPRLMGRVRAAEKLLLGEPFTGLEAVALGLANKALPASDVLNYARQIAQRFNQLPPSAVQASKRLLRADLDERIDATISREGAVFTERLRSSEAKEAFSAFFEKRHPDFSKL